MMIICSLVKIITTHAQKKNDIANTNNHCNILTEYIHYIPSVHTTMDYIDVYVI